MATEKFLASVQYGDWKGTSSADEADRKGLQEWVKANHYNKSDEILLGVSIYVGENYEAHQAPIFVNFLFASPGDHDSVKSMIDSSQGPVNVRKVSVEMKLAEFFGLFKRFSIALSSRGMLGEKDYTYVE